MNQTLGITFEARGAGQVVSELKKIATAVKTTTAALGQFSTQFSWLSNMSVSRLATDTMFVRRNIAAATHQARQLAAASKKGQADPTYPGMFTPPNHKRGTNYGGFGFMARWWGAYKGVQLAEQGAQEMLFAQSRASMMAPMRDLAAIGLDKSQRARAEEIGQKFIRSWPATGTIEDFLSSLAEVGSAIDINSKQFKGRGVEELSQITQSAMTLGAVSQMPAQQATKTLMSAVHAQLFQMSDQQRMRFETGEESIAKFSESTAAKIAKTIQITSIWGQDVQHFLNYSLPTALSKGWNMDVVLGLAGTMRTAGLQGQKAGRGLRALLEAETGKIAGLAWAGADPQLWATHQAMTPGKRKQAQAALIPILNQRLKKDPFGFFQDVGEWLKTAEQRGIDLVQGLGFSREWIGMLRLMTKSGTIKEWRAATEELSKASTLQRAQDYLRDVQADTGWLSKRWGDATKNFWSSVSQDSPLGGLVTSWIDALNMFTDWHKDMRGKAASEIAWESVKGTLDFAVHGALAGIADLTEGVITGALKELGVVSRDFSFQSVDQFIQRVTGLPTKIMKPVYDLFDWANKQISGVEQMLSGTAARTQSGIGRLNPMNWFKPGEMTSIVPEANNTAAPPPTLHAPMVGRQSAQPQVNVSVQAPEQPVVLENRLFIDGKEIANLVSEYLRQKEKQAGVTYGPALGTSHLW